MVGRNHRRAADRATRDAETARGGAARHADVVVDVDESSHDITVRAAGQHSAVEFVGAALEVDRAAIRVEGRTRSQRPATPQVDDAAGCGECAPGQIGEGRVDVVIGGKLVEIAGIADQAATIGVGELAAVA